MRKGTTNVIRLQQSSTGKPSWCNIETKRNVLLLIFNEPFYLNLSLLGWLLVRQEILLISSSNAIHEFIHIQVYIIFLSRCIYVYIPYHIHIYTHIYIQICMLHTYFYINQESVTSEPKRVEWKRQKQAYI